MNMSFGMGMRQGMGQDLTLSQKHTLKQLLSVKQELKAPEFPYAIKGLEGMKKADEVLKQANSSGFLIGGLGEAIWNERRSRKKLSEHKDVDVMVFSQDFSIPKKFYSGVDWWLPKKERILYREGEAEINEVATWWENGHEVRLMFGVELDGTLSPGLYIPDRSFMIDVRSHEALTHKRMPAEVDEEVLDAFRNKLEDRIKETLPKYIAKEFAGRIASNQVRYMDNQQAYQKIKFAPYSFDKMKAKHVSDSLLP